MVMLNHATANGYSSNLWDGDLALVIYASNLTSSMQFKVRERGGGRRERERDRERERERERESGKGEER